MKRSPLIAVALIAAAAFEAVRRVRQDVGDESLDAWELIDDDKRDEVTATVKRILDGDTLEPDATASPEDRLAWAIVTVLSEPIAEEGSGETSGSGASTG